MAARRGRWRRRRCWRSGRRSPGWAGASARRRARRRGHRAHAGGAARVRGASRASTARASRAIGTEALRRAPNAAEFLGPARGDPGRPRRGHRRRARGGADLPRGRARRSRTRPRARMVVVDIGGGSTGDHRRGARRACDSDQPAARLGAPDRAAHAPRSARPRPSSRPSTREVDAALARRPVAARRPPTLVGIAGTVTSLAAMALAAGELRSRARPRLPPDRGGARRADRAPGAGRPRPSASGWSGLDPRRADVILAGALILRAHRRAAGAADVLVSDRGIRWGLLYETPDGPTA